MWHQVMIPNEAIISNNIENYSVRKNRRVDFNIWLVYTTTIKQMEKWIKIIEDILNSYVELKTVSEFRVNFEQFWDFSLNIIVTYYSLINSNYNKFLKQKEKINLEIKKQLTQANLEIAFPTQELIIKK
jgi:MscS family membrane protein